MISPKATPAQLGRNVLIRVNSRNAATGDLDAACNLATALRLAQEYDARLHPVERAVLDRE